MKVVLIAESEDTIAEYSSFLEEAGADVITYRWFLKALDNLTEIQPHIIIVSALDFPRHWKTLFTHIEAGEIKTQPLVYLITDPSFTASEKKKAMFLGAQDIFQSPLTNRDKNSLLSMLPAGMGIEPPSKKEDTVQEAPLEEPCEEHSETEEAVGEYAELQAHAAELEEAKENVINAVKASSYQLEENAPVSENRIHNISAAEANAFELIDSEISNLENDTGPASEIAEITDETEENESLVVEGADEDILTKLEDEMTESSVEEAVAESEPEPVEEPVAENEPEPAEEPVSEIIPDTIDITVPVSQEESDSESLPETEQIVHASPSFDDEIERPEQVTWSAPIDEISDPVQFSFVNPRSGLVVTGSVLEYNHPTIKFVPSSPDAVEGIRFGQILEQCKFTFEGDIIKTRAQIRGLGKAIEFCLLY